MRAVADAGLVYDLLTLPPQLPAAIETVRALDDLVFVVDHLSKPPIASGELEPWATHMRTLAAHENVVCKLSGMVTEARLGRPGPWTTCGPYADDRARGLRARPGDVRLRLAGVHARREL